MRVAIEKAGPFTGIGREWAAFQMLCRHLTIPRGGKRQVQETKTRRNLEGE